jgi:hypothetical protein
MTEANNSVRKVGASAGAEWLLGGFALLRRSPFGLGLLGAIFGGLALTANLAMLSQQTTLALVLQLALVLLGPLLVAGMVYAAREVDEGRGATPAHLLRGIQDGKVPRLLATLLPQVVAAVVAIVLLVVVIGPSQWPQIMAIMQQLEGQANPDPDLVRQLPVSRFGLWLLLVFVIGILASFCTFTAIPQMMFSERGAIASMKDSFRACLRNLPAMVVFFLLLLVAAIALNFAVLLVALVVKLVAGTTAMQVVAQLLMVAVLMPVVTGAMYHAWKQLHGNGRAAVPAAPAGFEA